MRNAFYVLTLAFIHSLQGFACDNSTVIRATEMKLSPKVVINAISSQKNCTFDVSFEGLAKLKQAGVADEVVEVMQAKMGQVAPPSGATPSDAAPISQPQMATLMGSMPTGSTLPKVVLSAGVKEPIELRLERAMPSSDRGFMGYKAIRLKGADKTTKILLEGPDSPVQVNHGDPITITITGSTQPGFGIVELKANKTDRTLGVLAIGMTRQKPEYTRVDKGVSIANSNGVTKPRRCCRRRFDSGREQ